MKKILEKKNIINIVILFALTALAFFLIYKSANPEDLLKILKSVKIEYLILALLSFLLYRIMEGLGFFYLFKCINKNLGLMTSISYSFIGYFFGQITPSGGGGQPGQIYYMTRDGVKLSEALSVLLPFNIIYHISLIVFTVISLNTNLGHLVLLSRLSFMFYLGLVIQILIVIFMFSLFFSKKLVETILIWINRFIGKLPFLSRFSKKEHTVVQYVDRFHEKLLYIKDNRKSLLVVFFIQIFMLCFYYLISYFVYRSLGFTRYNFIDIVGIQCLISISVESMPSPGAAGFAEVFMYSIYRQILSKDLGLSWMMLTRGISLYLGLFLGIITVYIKNSKKWKEGID